jgi:uncharacterized protein YqhQ
MDSPIISNLIDGGIRLIIFLLYLVAISFIPAVREILSYHGAEHKVINAYEDGAELEIEAVQRYSTAHARCGTGLILIILVLAIIVFAFLGQHALWLRFLERLALFPIIAAISYELMRLAAMHSESRIARIVIAPGSALQALTTRQPDDKQIEVAIAALQGAIEADEESLTPDRNKSSSPYGIQDPSVLP